MFSRNNLISHDFGEDLRIHSSTVNRGTFFQKEVVIADSDLGRLQGNDCHWFHSLLTIFPVSIQMKVSHRIHSGLNYICSYLHQHFGAVFLGQITIFVL